MFNTLTVRCNDVVENEFHISSYRTSSLPHMVILMVWDDNRSPVEYYNVQFLSASSSDLIFNWYELPASGTGCAPIHKQLRLWSDPYY